MKKNLIFLFMMLVLACTFNSVHAQPYIESLSRNGQLVTTNLPSGSGATVEWASTVAGPWSETWKGLQEVVADSNGMVRVEVPMFYRVRVSNPDPSRLVWISPGAFMMGSPTNEAERGSDEFQHEVTISRGFWIGKYEVTQERYQEVLETNSTGFSGVNLPVGASWHNATNFCTRLTERERAAKRLPDGYVYRLPTEAEWEYACRAGTRTALHYGAALISGMANFAAAPLDGGEYVSSVGTIVNFDGINLFTRIAVGSYEPNPWGLYDMHGNLNEWCSDWYGDYPVGPVIDPEGPETGMNRVTRGGGFSHNPSLCRSAARENLPLDAVWVGFRVVLGHPYPLQ